jgi:hypothetical protein
MDLAIAFQVGVVAEALFAPHQILVPDRGPLGRHEDMVLPDQQRGPVAVCHVFETLAESRGQGLDSLRTGWPCGDFECAPVGRPRSEGVLFQTEHRVYRMAGHIRMLAQLAGDLEHPAVERTLNADTGGNVDQDLHASKAPEFGFYRRRSVFIALVSAPHRGA